MGGEGRGRPAGAGKGNRPRPHPQRRCAAGDLKPSAVAPCEQLHGPGRRGGRGQSPGQGKAARPLGGRGCGRWRHTATFLPSPRSGLAAAARLAPPRREMAAPRSLTKNCSMAPACLLPCLPPCRGSQAGGGGSASGCRPALTAAAGRDEPGAARPRPSGLGLLLRRAMRGAAAPARSGWGTAPGRLLRRGGAWCRASSPPLPRGCRTVKGGF